MTTPAVHAWLPVALILICAILMVMGQTSNDVQLFVDPAKGNDAGTGTMMHPFKTLARAQLEVRNYAGAKQSQNVIVQLMAGVHQIPSTMVFDGSLDSGNNGYTVRWNAYHHGQVTISGGVKVATSWKLVDTSKRLWVTALDSTITKPSRQLYVNGRRASRPGRKPFSSGNMVNITSTGYLTNDMAMLQWSNIGNAEVIWTGGGSPWTQSRCPIQSITQSSLPNMVNITMVQPCFYMARNRPWGQGEGVPSGVENVLELIGATVSDGGEYYYDTKKSLLYYTTRVGEDINQADVWLPQSELLVSAVNGLHHVIFTGIIFSHATWLQSNGRNGYVEMQAGFLYINNNTAGDDKLVRPTGGAVVFERGTHHISVHGCTFRSLGGNALVLAGGSQYHNVSNTIFTDISATALQVGDVYDPLEKDSSRWTTGHIISNNLIVQSGREYVGNAALFVGYTTDCTISQNTIHDVPYSAMNVGWGWSREGPMCYARKNTIANNLLFNYMGVLVDGGGLYTLGIQPGSVAYGNYLANQGNPFGALYHDEGSGFWEDWDNVIRNVPYWLHIWINTIHDLYVHDCFTDSWGMDNWGTNCTVNEITYVTPNYEWPEAAQQIIGRSGCDMDVCPSPVGIATLKPVDPSTIWPSHILMSDAERQAAILRAPKLRALFGKLA